MPSQSIVEMTLPAC